MSALRCSRTGRLRAGLAIGVLVALGAALPRPAAAEGKGRIELRARVEPADLAPGAKGVLVLKATLGSLVVFADGQTALAWRAVPATGVRYGTPETPVRYADRPEGVEMTAPSPLGEAGEASYPVWRDAFELRIPVEIGKDASPATRLAVSFDYSACDPEVCHARQKDHRASVTLGAPAEPAEPDVALDAPAATVPAFPVVDEGPFAELPETGPLEWTRVETVERLQQEVARAVEAGKPVVVALTATWCTSCKKYLSLLDSEVDLREGLAGFVRLEIDVTSDARTDLRAALGIGPGQPRMTFLDRRGRILRSLDVDRLHGDAEESNRALRRRLVRILSGSA